MTNEERDIITRFIERVGGASPGGFAGPGQAPTGQAPQLPPIDREADALIAELFNRHPEARYRLTQTAFVQEQALVEAQNRIKRMEWELEQARQAQQAPQSPWNTGAGAGSVPPTQPAPSRGFFSGLFGGGSQQQSAPPQYQQPPYQQQPYQQQPPQPQYQPPYQPGAFQRSGSGFLGSALTTAAGVAGGMVVGNALMDLFSPHHASASPGLAAGFGAPVPGVEGPWSGGPSGANPWDNATNAPDPSAGWDNAADPGAGWNNAPDPGAGWDNAANTPDNTNTPDSNWDNASDTSGGDWGTDPGGDSGGFDDI
jgi:hypothetical protein